MEKRKKVKRRQNKCQHCGFLLHYILQPFVGVGIGVRAGKKKLEAQVGQKSLTWLTLIMTCYIVPWWPPWLSDHIAFSNPESDVV